MQDDTGYDDDVLLAELAEEEITFESSPLRYCFRMNTTLAHPALIRRYEMPDDPHPTNPFFIGNSLASGPKPPSWALEDETDKPSSYETPDLSLQDYYETPEDYMLSIHFNITEQRWQDTLKARRSLYRHALREAFKTLKLPPYQYALALSFVNDREIRAMNAEYRHKDKATNVLSFPQVEDFTKLDTLPSPVELGDIILAYETIAAEAKAQKKQFEHHLTHLMVHGLLHLCGFDHESKADAKKMEALEIAVLAQLGISNPYEH